MAIDDPNAALAALNDSEKRSEFLPHKGFVATLLSASFGSVAAVGASAGALEATVAAGVFTVAASLVNRAAEERVQQLIEDLREELRNRSVSREMLEEQLTARDKGTQELVAEAVVRASEAKSRERVRRIAHLLTNILLSTEEVEVEDARVMLDIAGNLFDLDAFVLGKMYDAQHKEVERRQGHPELNEVMDSWRALRERHQQFREGTINSSGSRLQAHGLLLRVQPSTGQTDLQTYVFAITEFGIRFCRWCLKEIN
ncbi:MAG TPA: hypothetical protein VHZ09_11940 [Acidobacteriaceae bacterium]|jgi:hypothetical protein|nr:hypothetical protein [Acidobacteriaceae bacterium]